MELVDSIKLDGKGAQEIVPINEQLVVTSLEQSYRNGNMPAICIVNKADRILQHLNCLPNYIQQPIRICVANSLIAFLQGDNLVFIDYNNLAIAAFKPFGDNANLTSLAIVKSNNQIIRLLVGNSGNYVEAGSLKDILYNVDNYQIQELQELKVGIIPGNILLF